jgi:outer membrane protein assembly factor BamD
LHEKAILADMGIADSYFSDKDYLEAENAYNDFINLHPTNENVPYAIYQVGMCHYKKIEAIDRDQTETVKARKEFEKLIVRYPESKFATTAEKVLRECKQKQAEHEFYVGKFYFTQKKYQAALTRFEKIARDFANIGLDYKVEYLISETKIKIAEEEKLKKDQEAKEKQKTAQKQ